MKAVAWILVLGIWVTTWPWPGDCADAPFKDENMSLPQQRDFLFVLDISASMMGATLSEVQQTAVTLVARLDATGRDYSLGLITFSGCETRDVQVVLPLGERKNSAKFLSALGAAQPNGTTAIELALRKAKSVLDSYPGKRCVSVILLTDGEETCGGNPWPLYEELPKHANSCQGGFQVVHLGKDRYYGDLLEQHLEQNLGRVITLSEQNRKMDLQQSLGQFFSVEADAEQSELRQANNGSGSGKSAAGKRDAKRTAKPPAAPAEAAQPAAAEALEMEKKRRQLGGGTGKPQSWVPRAMSGGLALAAYLFGVADAEAKATSPHETWPAEPPSKVVRSVDGEFELFFYDPGLLERSLEGALYWSGDAKQFRLGPCPKSAFPVDSGAYAVLQRDGLISIEFWGIDGSRKVLNPGTQYRWDLLDLRYFVELTAAGVQVSDRQQTSESLYTISSGPRAALSRMKLTPDSASTLAKFGRSLLAMAKDRQMGAPLILPAHYARFQAALKPGEGKSVMITTPDGMSPSEFVYQLAIDLASGAVPAEIADWDLYEIDAASLGTEGKADLSKDKIRSLVSAASGRKVILYFVGIDRLIGLGGTSGDLLDDLMPAVSRGDIYLIAASGTGTELASRLSQKASVKSGFNELSFPPYDLKKELPELLRIRTSGAAGRSKIEMPAGFEASLIGVADVYFPEVPHPASDLIVLDRLTDMAKGRSAKVLDAKLLRELVQVLNSEIPYIQPEKTNTMRAMVEQDLIGQRGPKDRMEDCFKRRIFQGGIEKKKPVCVFLALGGSGTGKTFSAELLAQHFGTKLESWPMEDYKEAHTLYGFIGAPPGYVGFNHPGLVGWMRQNKTGLAVLDEIDKAHVDVIQGLNTLFDEARLKGLDQSTAYFNKGVVFMTSNFGIEAIREWEEQNPDWRAFTKEQLYYSQNKLIQKIQDQIKSRRLLPDWVMGRIPITNWLVYTNLNREEGIQLAHVLAKRALKSFKGGYTVQLSDEVYGKLVDGYYGKDSTGARPLQDGISYLLYTELNDLLQQKGVAPASLQGKTVEIVLDGDSYALRID